LTRHTFGLLALLAAVLSSCPSIHWGYDDVRAVAHLQVEGTPKAGTPIVLRVWYLDAAKGDDLVVTSAPLDEASRTAWVSVILRRATYFGPNYPKGDFCCASLSIPITHSGPGLLRIAARVPNSGPFDYRPNLSGATLPATTDIFIDVAP